MAKVSISQHIKGLKALEQKCREHEMTIFLADDYRAFWRVLDFLALDPRVPDSVIDRILEEMELP